MSRSSRQGARDQQSAFGKTVAAAQGAITAFVSVGTAIKLSTQYVQNYNQRIGEAMKANERFSNTLAPELLFTGDLANVDEVKKFLEGRRGVTREQALEAFGGVTGGAPALPFIDEQGGIDRQGLAEAVERLAPVLTNIDDSGNVQGKEKLRQFGAVVGRLAKLSEGNIKSADDIADLALLLSQEAGDTASQLTSPTSQKAIGGLTKAGVPFVESLAITAESLEETGAATGAQQLASKLNPAEGITLEALRADEAFAREKLGDRAFAEFRKLNTQEINDRVAKFNEVFERDIVGEQRQFANDLDPIRFLAQTTASRRDQQLRDTGDRERNLEEQARFLTNELPVAAQSIPGVEFTIRTGLRLADATDENRALFGDLNQRTSAFIDAGEREIEGGVRRGNDQLVDAVREQTQVMQTLLQDRGNGRTGRTSPPINRTANVEQ